MRPARRSAGDGASPTTPKRMRAQAAPRQHRSGASSLSHRGLWRRNPRETWGFYRRRSSRISQHRLRTAKKPQQLRSTNSRRRRSSRFRSGARFTKPGSCRRAVTWQIYCLPRRWQSTLRFFLGGRRRQRKRPTRQKSTPATSGTSCSPKWAGKQARVSVQTSRARLPRSQRPRGSLNELAWQPATWAVRHTTPTQPGTSRARAGCAPCSGVSATVCDGVRRAHLSRCSPAGVGNKHTWDLDGEEDMFEQYRKRMMLGYRHRPNPNGNPRKLYY